MRIAHCGAAIVIFVEECRCFLWDAKIPEYAPYKEYHFAGVACHHKSASVEDPATVGWNLHLYAMVPPESRTHKPPKDRRVLMHVAQSESAYAWAVVASNCGRLSRSKSVLLLWIDGRGPSGSSSRGAVRQKYKPSLRELYRNLRACLRP